MKPRRTIKRDLASAFSRYVLDVEYDGWEYTFSQPLAICNGDHVSIAPDSVVFVANRTITAVGAASSEGRWYFKEKL